MRRHLRVSNSSQRRREKQIQVGGNKVENRLLKKVRMDLKSLRNQLSISSSECDRVFG